MIRNLFRFLLLSGLTLAPAAFAEKIVNIEVQGNAKVQADAIVTILDSGRGEQLDQETIKSDVLKLFDLGYFSDIRILKRPEGDGVRLIVKVVEKPAITSIDFSGMEEVKVEDIREKMQTKLYTIVNEAQINADVRVIEKQYAELGFFLAKVTYTLTPQGEADVALKFIIEEGSKVQVAEIDILGNQYYSDAELIERMITHPLTRSSAFGSRSLFREDFVENDMQILSFLYRDQGFAEVKVSRPHKLIDVDREYVRMTLSVEEGLQYNVATIKVTGDLLIPEAELLEAMALKSGDLFRISKFRKDIEMLVDRYGDFGYAYVDVNPRTEFDREGQVVALNYEITKGEKVYFGTMTISGNDKTRDNVIRREMEVQDTELYSGTGLAKTKRNINRLGFFEEVQVIKKRNPEDSALMDLDVKVKEKPTGQLQAALGYSPATTTAATWFGQGRYDEKNQSGYGWNTNLSGKWDGRQNYKLEAGFTNPRVNDSHWSLGINGSYEEKEVSYIRGIPVEEVRHSYSFTVGRKIIELLRGSLTYRRRIIEQKSNAFLLEKFRNEGVTSS